MDLRTYEWHGKTWQFEAGKQPADAVEAKPKAAEQPANKARKSPAKKATADA